MLSRRLPVLPRPRFARRLTILILSLATLWPAVAPGQLPDPALAKYNVRSDKLSAIAETLNYETTRTRTVNLAGKSLLFDASAPQNTLFADFQNHHNIRQLNIYAEQVVIRGQLRLPQSEVNIYAYELRFEDPAGALEPASLATTPYTLPNRPGNQGDGANGADGLTAGDINLTVATLTESDQPHFILRGGDGQPAGLGRNGADGVTMKTYDGHLHLPVAGIPANTIRIVDFDFGMTDWEGGPGEWPGDGEDAVAAGIPGRGGNGGILHSALALGWGVIDVSGGNPGLKGFDTYGGRPGQPLTSHLITIGTSQITNSYGILSDQTHTSKNGANASAPMVILGTGQPGDYSQSGSPGAWFHPFLLKSILLYAQDLIDADKALTSQMLTSYLGAFNAYKLSDPWHAMSATEQAGYNATAQAMTVLRDAAARNAARNWNDYR